MESNQPYFNYEHLVEWKVIKRAIEELQANSDILLQTDIHYVVGYIIGCLDDGDVLCINQEFFL